MFTYKAHGSIIHDSHKPRTHPRCPTDDGRNRDRPPTGRAAPRRSDVRVRERTRKTSHQPKTDTRGQIPYDGQSSSVRDLEQVNSQRQTVEWRLPGWQEGGTGRHCFMGTRLLSGKTKQFWKQIIVMAVNTRNILKPPNDTLQKHEFYGMCGVFQLKRGKINSF